MSFDRCDFEQQIMECWSICEALDNICEGVLEYDLNKDQIANITIGLKELYQLRFNKLFDMFETGVREKKIV